MIVNIDSIPLCVINLPSRTERLERTKWQLKQFYGFDKSFNVIEGVVERYSFAGIAQSHMNAVQLAKDNKWPMVCIAEDDVHFQSMLSKQYADSVFREAPEDFDILLSGIYYGVPINASKGKPWTIVKEFSALHYYVVHERAYNKILAFNKTANIDFWLGSSKGANLKCYVPDKFFAIQFNGFSDNVGQEKNYDDFLKPYKIL